jgi:4-amino-4-deoxy-L-arabinose transferase-like glycosyltransferase
LSLALWVFCPNILAHARLVTSDLCATAMGVASTYLFWRYLHAMSWRWALAAGVGLGLAQLSKFSMLLLYAIWPILWLIRFALLVPASERLRQLGRSLVQGIAIVALSIVTIDLGYFLEGVGIPLGEFEFGSRSLTRPVPPGLARPHSKNLLYEAAWQFRINRFRGTWLGRMPMPLPEHFLLGFDEQKIETEGIPRRFTDAVQISTPEIRAQIIAQELQKPERNDELKSAYEVYLNGELRRSGWSTYYLLALLYKVPEGTWVLVLLSLGALVLVKRSRSGWADEVALLVVPLVILISMTVLTDINLGLRYVLPIFPYVFIAAGKLVPWTMSLAGKARPLIASTVALSLGMTIAATLWIAPHFLAYFNWASGGPDRVPARLIDSNLDWGQDLIALQEWCRDNIPGQRIGLAYFGQINPTIFALREEPFSWFLPPVRPGLIQPMQSSLSPLLEGPAQRLTPGYYAVSATLLYGLPWRLYDPVRPELAMRGLMGPSWSTDEHAFSYFRQFQPIMPPIGHSIYVYRLSAEDVARVSVGSGQ